MGKESVLTTDMTKCFVCGSPYVEKHHVFGGCDRDNSEKFGLFVPLCRYHHTGDIRGNKEAVHYNKEFMDMLHEIGQMKFEELHPDLRFRDYFRKNYV